MVIQGKYASALCFARVIDDTAIEQIRTMCDTPFTEGSQIRIMPDVHAGTGCTIGTTMTVHGKAVPNVVGVDIGCGMYSVKLNTSDMDFEKIDEAAHYIPSGFKVWEECIESFDLTKLRCYHRLHDVKRLEYSLGTLGGGNHFIEVDRDSSGACWLVVHSGSRNLGKQVAKYYQDLAVELQKGKDDLTHRRDALIAEYKASGRVLEIAEALENLKKEYQESKPVTPRDLCWLYGSSLEDYLHDVEICQRFAVRSRELMAEILLQRTGMQAVESFHTIHNYIDTDEMILRKGAIAAHKGERVLIPINMRDGSVLAIGRGNPDWNYSAPHGAGRILSRSEAREKLKVTDFAAAMEGVYTTSVNENTLDESPMAYKSLEDIVEVIRDSVDIVDIMKPIYNFKASDSQEW